MAWGLLTLLGCDELEHDPSDPTRNQADQFLILQPAAESVGVGLRDPVRIVATVTKDAAGESCQFSSTSGSFAPSAVQTTVMTAVDLNGRAAVAWFPPSAPGAVVLSARVGTVSGDTVVTVTPVPDVDLSGVPATVSTGQTVQARVAIDPRWAGHGVELRIASGELRALGPTEGDLGVGTRILPVLDHTGRADFLLSAPAMAGGIVLTGSLLGTVRSTTVQVQDPGGTPWRTE